MHISLSLEPALTFTSSGLNQSLCTATPTSAANYQTLLNGICLAKSLSLAKKDNSDGEIFIAIPLRNIS